MVSQVKNYDKIKGFIYTEKSNKEVADSKYTFSVDKDFSKEEISKLVEELFKVKIKKINTQNYKPESVRFRGKSGTKKAFKKAIVTLEKGQTIKLN